MALADTISLIFSTCFAYYLRREAFLQRKVSMLLISFTIFVLSMLTAFYYFTLDYSTELIFAIDLIFSIMTFIDLIKVILSLHPR